MSFQRSAVALAGAATRSALASSNQLMAEDRSTPLRDEEIHLFESLMLRHQEQFYRVAYRLTGNRDDAEDLVQESLLEAFQSFRRFRPGTHFDRWVHRIMSHTYIDRLRKGSRVRIESLDQPRADDESESFQRELPDLSAGPESRALSSETDRQVQAALLELPEEFRLAVVLCDLEGLSYEEIAQMVRCPVGTVRSRIHRGRSMLAKKLSLYVHGSV